MAAVTIHSDIGAQEKNFCHCLYFPPIYFLWSEGTRCHGLSFFWIFSFKPAFSLSSLILIKMLFSSSLLSAIREVSSPYLRLLIFLLAILIPACDSSSPEFLIMYSKYKLNKQGDSMQPCRTPFPILNQSVSPYKVLVVASWPTYRFLLRKVRWPNIPISLSSFHSYCDPHNQRFLHSQWSRNRFFFWNSIAVSMIQWMLIIWSLIPLLFLNPAYTSGSSQFTYCWSLAGRILSITLLACEMSATV